MALDAKSPYTAGLSKSVSDMVEILCRLLGLNRMMHIASHLHDIGKIGIDDAILLFEAIKEKRLKWDDILTCSAYASSMGGSQVYLEENETMSVFELFKCIAIASANDAKHIG